MQVPECPSCLVLAARVAELERELAAVKGMVKPNSSNSSTPPSANPLGAPKPVVKKRSKRRPGGQPGHKPHFKELLPLERVTKTFEFVPKECKHCLAVLPRKSSADDPAPTRHQVLELPEVIAEVTEYQGHARICECCGLVTRESIPAELLAHGVGPRLAGALSYLTGCHGISKRGVAEIAENLFGAPICVGTVANLEREMSAALEAPHQEAVDAVRAAEIKNADETSWKERGKLCWLWAAATVTVAAFVIHSKRSAKGLTAILGQTITGILCTDRWGVYARVAAHMRQICWAHLKRDFQKIVDKGGESIRLGRRGLRIVKEVFAAWHEFKEGKVTRAELQEAIAPLENRMNRLLIEGAILDEYQTVKKFCENVLALEAALWTFTRVVGVEPTNNHMERLVRLAVLWRKRSFGCWSNDGCRFVERILTVVQTRRLRGANTLEYLRSALQAHRAKEPCPSLLKVDTERKNSAGFERLRSAS